MNPSKFTITVMKMIFLKVVLPFLIVLTVEKISIGLREKETARNNGKLLNFIISSGILSIAKCAHKSKYLMYINKGAVAKKLTGTIIKKKKNFANFKIIESIF